MTRPRRFGRTLSVLLAVVGLVFVAAPSAVLGAPATAVVDDGWWNRAQSGVGLAVPPPPGVGEEQLVVQLAVGGESARAAVAAELADGQVAPVLTLSVADVQGSPLVVACQAGSAWTGVHNGNWDARPTAECSTNAVGQFAEDGSTISFDLTALQFNDKINVVLVPAVEEGAPSVPFRLVVDQPTGADIVTSDGDAPPPTTAAPATTSTAPPTTSSPPSTSNAGFTPPPTAAVVPPPSTTTTMPAPTLTPAIDPTEEGLTATAPIVNEVTAPAPSIPVSETTSRTGARIVGLLVLAVAAVAGVAAWRDSSSAPLATATTPVVGGLARFRGERTAEPPSIS